MIHAVIIYCFINLINLDTALIIIGAQGAGKDTIATVLMQRIFCKCSPYYVHVQDINELKDRFNSRLQDKLLISVNEVHGEKSKKITEQLKTILTERQMRHEKKHVDSITKNCFARYIFESNHDDCMLLAAKDRRFAAFKVSNKYVGNTEHFNMIYRLIKDDKVIENFFNYLRFFSIIKDLKKIIETETRINLMKDSCPAELRWLWHIAEAAIEEDEYIFDCEYETNPVRKFLNPQPMSVIEKEKIVWKKGEELSTFIPSYVLFNDFTKWIDRKKSSNNYVGPFSSDQRLLSKKLMEVFSGIYDIQSSPSTFKGKSVRGYKIFPSPNTVIECLENYVKRNNIPREKLIL